jgi:hypothetical protein
MAKATLGIIFAAFAALSAAALWQHGYLGLWQAGVATLASMQLLADLVILALLACAWMLRDAQASGRKAWPYIALTLAAGSFGPLLYLLLAPRAAAASLKGELA